MVITVIDMIDKKQSLKEELKNETVEFVVTALEKILNEKIDDKKDKKVMETITAEELMGLISKLNSASGILVNKKI
jgi:uncharacterized FlaG/YvyC family protein